jgi:hypothetical protein
LSSFSSAELKPGGHKFKNDGETKADVTRWLIAQTETVISSEEERLSHSVMNASVVVGTAWTSSGAAVQLNINCSF